MKNKFFFSLIILISIIISVIPNQIIFPFTTKSYPFDPNKEFKYILKNEIFTTIEVGNPPQKVELFLTTKTPYFIIKKNDTYPNYYNSNLSSTYKYYENTSIYYLDNEVIQKGIYSTEQIYLKKSFEDQTLTPVSNLDFIYGIELTVDDKEHMGILGLQFFSTSFIYSKEVNLMVVLKKSGLTSNYLWNLYYTSDKDGYLVIGDHPHNYDPKKYVRENMRQVNVHADGFEKIEWKLNFNEIKYGELDVKERKLGKFAPQYGVILGPNFFDKIITKEFFQKHIDEKKCERKTYEMEELEDEYFDYYVCDENLDISNFQNIEFTEKDLSSKKFILTKEDLFLKKNGKLYFLIAFGQDWKWSYRWTLGKPFMKKFNFIFDEDGKQVIYYEQAEIDNVFENKTFVYFIWIGVGILVIIIAVLIFFLSKYLKERKKRKFELEDDYDYVTEEGKIEEKNDSINSNNGNNSNKEKIFKFEGDEGENKFGI